MSSSSDNMILLRLRLELFIKIPFFKVPFLLLKAFFSEIININILYRHLFPKEYLLNKTLRVFSKEMLINGSSHSLYVLIVSTIR